MIHDPSRWDDPNAAARCQTPADLTGASGADRAGPGNPAGAKGLLLQAPGGRAAATASGDSCRAGRASTAACYAANGRRLQLAPPKAATAAWASPVGRGALAIAR
eukprot:scaffold2151_cov99-Isochrysis_galbana.AAC.3